jgi:N-methylhydantoinase A
VKTFYARLDEARVEEIASVYAAMENAARAMLHAAGVPEARWGITRAADCRYGRQAYELTVPMGSGAVTPSSLARLAEEFHGKHRQTYGHASPDEPVQLVNLRVAAVGRLEALDVANRGAAAPAGGGSAQKSGAAGSRDVYFKETGVVRCDVIPREALAPGERRAGPLIIEAMDTTVVVPPGWRAGADARGFIDLDQEARS